jgi:MFS family permease
MLSLLNHVAMNGSRVSVSLTALSLQASAFTVGSLMAVYALLPMLVSIWLGRWIDRIGMRKPVLIGMGANFIGVLLPGLWPGLPALFITATVVGVGFTTFLMATQNAIGDRAEGAQRTANFSHLALGMAVSGTLGPLVAGHGIQHLGHRYAFVLLACFSLTALVFTWWRRGELTSGPHPHADASPRGHVLALLRGKPIRQVLLANVLLAMGWDLHAFIVPIYGHQIGLAAATIGNILGTFGFAVFVIRVALPWLRRHFTEWQIIRAALWIGGLTFALFPFVKHASLLFVLAFALGLALGGAQPSVLSLLHAISPPGRTGEVLGLRIALLNLSHVALPLFFGGLGTAIGLPVVFWSLAGGLLAGGWLAPGKAAR